VHTLKLVNDSQKMFGAAGYEAMALEIEDIFAILSGLKQPEYELTLLVVTCQLRISEALGLKWRDVLWNRGLIAIRQVRP
jgi:integrase